MAESPQPIPREPASGGDYDRLETLLKNLPGMAYRCLNLEHWPMDFVSDGCYELCGYQRHEIESQAVLWGDFTDPEMIDEVARKVKAVRSRVPHHHAQRPGEVGLGAWPPDRYA
jgi:hypothetical protein